jgi:PAS domain S-box-containing protein
MIVVHSRTGKQFSQDDLDFLSNLANLGAVALDNARLYHELSRSEKNYRLLFEKASDLIIALNYENIIGYINQRVISILGYNPPDLMGKDARMVFTRASYQVLIRQHEKMAEGNLLPSDTLELTMTGKEGQLITLEFSFTQLTHDNETPGLLGIGRDLTVRKRIEEQERMRMLGQLASGVAHDFNNILAIVLGHAQLIEEAIENEEIRRTLQIIAQSARDGADTVRRIQEFTGQRTDRPSNQVDLNRIVRDTLELSRPRWRNAAQKDGLYYEIVQSFEALPPVLGKASELREVVINIINNALDAMLPPGGRLAFATRHRPPWVELEISDTGKGIEPDILSRIFEPFFTTKGTRGTGLGLSIAKNIITRHGGELLCASTVGVGTIFTIKLPAVDKQTIENIAEDIPLENGKEMGKQNQGRILAIDDDPGIRNVLKRVLQSGGYNVELAASALEALKLLKAADKGNGYPFDLILSDLGMPEMSGWDLAREVKKRWPRVPILLITGWGEQVDATRMNENSIRDIIPKPFNIQDLLKQVNRHIHS